MKKPVKRVSTKLADQVEHNAYQYYVPPPGRGEPQVTKGLRLTLAFSDAVDELTNTRDQNGGKVFPFKTGTDALRAAAYLGYQILVGLTEDSALNETAAQFSLIQKMDAVALRQLQARSISKRHTEILDEYIAQGAMDEARDYYKAQWNIATEFKDGGYQQMIIHQGLTGYKERLFGKAKVVGLKGVKG